MQKLLFVSPKNLQVGYIKLLNILFFCFPISILIGNAAINVIIFLICLIGFFAYSKKLFLIKNDRVVLLFLVFFLILFISTALDFYKETENQNFLKSILYFRYFILFLVTSLLVKSGKFELKYFLISSFICTTFLSLDIIYQLLFGSDIFGFVGYSNNNTFHLSGFLKNEYFAGGYIQRFCIFSLVLFPFFFIKEKKYKLIIPILLCIIFFSGILFSGNRIPLLIFTFSSALIIIVIKDLRLPLLIGIMFCFFIFYQTLSTQEKFKVQYSSFYHNVKAIFLNINEYAFKKYPELENKKKYFVGEVFKGNEEYKKYNLVVWGSGHSVIYLTALDLWSDKPILGYGIKSFRIKCKTKLHLPNRVCQAHPHNYYLELLNDSGVIGTLAFLIGVILLFRDKYLNFKNYKKNEKLILYCLSIIIISELFPLRSSGSFFSTQISSYVFLILGIFNGIKKIKI